MTYLNCEKKTLKNFKSSVLCICRSIVLFIVLISLSGFSLSCSKVSNKKTEDKEYQIFAYNTRHMYLISITNNEKTVKRIGGEFDGEIFVPTLSPDGKKISLRFEPASQWHEGLLYIMNIDGTERIDLLAEAEDILGPQYGTPFSPDGKKVAFIGLQYSDSLEVIDSLYLVNIDGTERVDLLKGTGMKGKITGPPVFSPDGKKILFDFNYLNSELHSLYLFDLEEQKVINLVKDIGKLKVGALFSPDGKKVLFDFALSPGPSNYSLNIINIDGTERIDLAENIRVVDWHSRFSPDGKKVAFIGYESSKKPLSPIEPLPLSLYIVNIDGTDRVDLLKGMEINGNVDYCTPIFSRDGRKILFSTKQPRSFERPSSSQSLYMFDLDKKKVINLVESAKYIDGYSFSPDEKKVLFEGTFEGNEFVYKGGIDNITGEQIYHKESKNIYVINADGSQMICLDDIVGESLQSAEWFLFENSDF